MGTGRVCLNVLAGIVFSVLALVLLLLFIYLSGPRSPFHGGMSPCEADYPQWLSHPDAFPEVVHDQSTPKSFPGLHVLCFWQKEDVIHVEAFFGGVWPASNVARDQLLLDAKDLKSWGDFRRSLKEELQFSKRSNNWGHLDLKQPFGLFDSGGHRFTEPKQVLTSQLVLLFEGGQWVWPPVRDGFIRKLDNGIELETLSLQPIVYRIRSFLKPEECEQIIDMGKPRMTESPILHLDEHRGKKVPDFRTSSQAQLPHSEAPLLLELDQRISAVTKVPANHNEEVQILRYKQGQYYAAHRDTWDPESYHEGGEDWDYGHKNRLATFFWYLNDVKLGGQTIFPMAQGLPGNESVFSCDHGLKVTPERGAAILWYSLHANGNTDRTSLHAACPVAGDELKWAANYWVWNKVMAGSLADMPDYGVGWRERLEGPDMNDIHVENRTDMVWDGKQWLPIDWQPKTVYSW